MPALVADTHAAIWFLRNDPKLSHIAREAMVAAVDGGHPIYISAITIVELVYLVEKGRIPLAALHTLEKELVSREPGFIVAPLDRGVAQALKQVPRSSVPDLPDRVIVATALALELALVTRDRQIRSSGVPTIW